VLVAIEIDKHRDEILIEEPGRVRRRRLTILKTRADHDRLVSLLRAYTQPVLVGFGGEARADRLGGAAQQRRL
jgi:hypothetical protein